MIRRKALFKVILIITALCLGTPSEAGEPCMWCDDKVSTPFMDCLTLRISNNPNFKSFASAMEEMKKDLLTASKVMKNNGPTKENVMKGALAFPLAGLIDPNENPDAKLSYINFVLNQCYPDRDYIDELVKIIKDILKEKGNLPNAQQPESETQSDEIPQAGQNISPSQENNYSPQQTSAADPNQEQNQWNVLDGKTQQQGQNFQPNPSQGSANNFALRSLDIPYGTFQQPPGLTNNGYSGSANQKQTFNPLQTYNQGNAYPNANQKYFSNPANSNPGASAAYRFYRYYEPQSKKRYIPSYAGSSVSAAYYDSYDYSPKNPASYQKPSLANIYKRKPTDSPQIKPESYDDKSPGTWQLQNPKKQPNTNDNSDQSPDDKTISYDKLIKNKAYKKDDQSYVDDETDYTDYDDNTQLPNYKPVNIKQKKGDQSSAKSKDSDDDYYDGSYECDDDDDRDGEDDSWNSNGEDSNINLRDDLGFSKKKQNPGTRLFQNQKKQPNTNDNSDQSPDDKTVSYDKLIKNKAYKKDDQSYVDDETDYSDYDDNTQLPNYKPVNIKQKKGDQSSAKSTDSDDDYYDGSYDCDDDDDYDRDGEDDSWNSNGEDSNINLRDDLGFSKKKQNPSTRLFQNQKKQPNDNDNSDQSPDDKAISYDKLIKNKTYKKDDQSYVNDKTNYSGYDDNNQPPNYKSVNIKQKSTDTDDNYYEGSYYDDDYYDDGEDDSWNSNSGNSNINLRDDLDFSKTTQNPGTWKFQNQKKHPNSDQSSDYEPVSHFAEKKQDLTNDSNVNDKSSKDTSKQKSDTLSLKNASKKNKQEDKYPDIFNISGDDPTTITKSKEPKRQKNKSPQYLPEFDKDEGQEITTLPPYIDDDQQTSTPPDIDPETSTSSDIDQQTSTLPDIDQKTTTAAIIQNTLKSNDKKKVLSVDAPVLQPNMSDNIQKLDFKKANHSESDDRVKILKKWALDCIKNGKFDYNILSRVIVGLIKSVQQTHPDWNLQKSQTTVLIETIFALAQLLLESNIKEVENLQQPQKTVELVKLTPNIQQSQIYQNVSQKNQNPNYQLGQANKNSQPAIQNKSSVDYSAPQKFIPYLPQNKKFKKKWGNNQNPLMQNTPRRQPDYGNTNPVPPQAILIPPQSTTQDNSWKTATNNNPGFKQNGNQGRWNNAQSRVTASSDATQNVAQGNNWNTVNQKGQNKLPQRNGNNANFPQSGKQPSIPGQVNRYQGNGKWGDKAFSIPQTLNPNVGVPGINTFPYLLGYQDNWPGLQQNPNFSQNRVQGNWDPTPKGSNSPSLLRNGNPGFIAEQGNRAFIPNVPSNPSFMRNGYQSGNQGIRRISPTDNSQQRYQWNRKK